MPDQHIIPRMHTAEHLLNQTMVRMFDCGRCVSAHLNRKKSKCDYDLCPCIGEHVRSTGELGRFRITTHDWSEGIVRLRFKLDENG